MLGKRNGRLAQQLKNCSALVGCLCLASLGHSALMGEGYFQTILHPMVQLLPCSKNTRCWNVLRFYDPFWLLACNKDDSGTGLHFYERFRLNLDSGFFDKRRVLCRTWQKEIENGQWGTLLLICNDANDCRGREIIRES